MTFSFSKTNGWGISSTTITPTPFHSYTKSPDVKHVRMAPKDANAALPTVHEHDVAAPPRHLANGTRPPVSAAQWNLGRKLRESSVVARLAAEHAGDPAKNHRSLLDKTAYFRFGAAAAAKAALAAQLDAVHAELGENAALPPEVRGAEMLVLTQAVALACKGHDPDLPAQALACLREVSLVDSIAHPGRGRPPGFDQEEVAAAWRIAVALEQTPVGFACLKKLGRQPHGGQPVHASVASHDDTILHAFLTASREKTRLDRGLPPDPQGVLSEIPDRPRTLLDKSLRAAQAHLAQSAAHARSRPGAAFKPVREEHEWAIGAVNNGFYTDARKDANGKTTPFHKADERLKKMSKWVSRANGTNHADPDGANPEALGKKTSVARKTARFLRNTLLPTMKKSPFNAINRQAPEIVPFVGASAGSALRNAEGGGAGEARALGTMVDVLARELEAGGISLAARAADPDAATLEGMVHLAILKQVKDDTKLMARYLTMGLNDQTRSQVKERVYAALEGHIAGQGQATRAAINALVDGQHTHLTAETLAGWAEQAGCPASVPDPEAHPGWHAFRVAQRRATVPVRAVDTPSLKTISKADTARMIEEHTRNHELGSRVVLYSGGVAGAGTKQLTGVFSKLISAGFVRVHADVKGERARCATVEIGTGPQGSELFLGTQRMATGQVGGGATARATVWESAENPEHTIGLGAGVNGAVGMEGTDKNGVMIRFERIATGVPGDQANNAKLGRLAAKLMAPGALPEGEPWANAPGEDGQSPLKNLLQEWPEVSVGMVESSDKAGHANGAANAVAGARFGRMQLGLGSLGASIAGRFRGRTASVETGGTLRVDKKAKFWNVKASVSASAGALGSVFEIDGADLDPGLTFIDGVAASVAVWKNGYTETDTLIEHQGELKKNSVRIKAHQHASSFVDSVAPRLDEWADAKVKRFNPDAYGALAPPDETPAQEQQRIQKRNAAIEAEHAILRQHLQRSLDKAEPTQTFWEFKEIKADAAAAVNALQSAAAMAEACGDKATVKECEKARAKLLGSEAAWEPTFLIDNETTTAQRSMTPVNFLLKSQQLDGINVSNMRIFT